MDHTVLEDPEVTMDLEDPKDPVAPVFKNLYVKCLIFLAKDDEDVGNHPLYSNDWMSLQGIA